MSAQYAGCNFTVVIAPIEVRGNFTAVSGLGAELEMEEVREGGCFCNTFLPRGVRYENIVLRRGTMPLDPLTVWFETVKLGMHLRYPMIVTMNNMEMIPVKIWTVMDVLPVKVEYSEMNALSDSVAITSIEFSHSTVINVM